MSGPLVSFCVKSYNQRPYLRAALEGALAQTYRPIEIVVSDDASTDGSWELIQSSFAKATEDRELGISVVLNRNEKNLGNLGNWEKICELAKGELLIKADGDDVSLPERTTRIVEEWEKGGKKALAICHSGWQIGPRDEGYGRLRQVTAGWPMGAAMAYSPELYRRFPKIEASYWRCMDDEIYTRRARMLGEVMEIPDRLVKYRIGVGATSSLWKVRDQVRFCHRDTLKTLEILARDWVAIPEANRAVWQEFLAAERRRLTLKLQLVDEPRFAERRCLIRALPCAPVFSVTHYMNVAWMLPEPLGNAMLYLYALLRNTYWRLQGGAK